VADRPSRMVGGPDGKRLSSQSRFESNTTGEEHQAMDRSLATETRKLLNLGEVAQMLRCSEAHISHLVNGKVPGVPPFPHARIGRRVLVKLEWLEDFLESTKE